MTNLPNKAPLGKGGFLHLWDPRQVGEEYARQTREQARKNYYNGTGLLKSLGPAPDEPVPLCSFYGGLRFGRALRRAFRRLGL
jgi:hypothetical protein